MPPFPLHCMYNVQYLLFRFAENERPGVRILQIRTAPERYIAARAKKL